MSVRLYRMTIASNWYDDRSGLAREFEMHFRAVRQGELRSIRRALARRGIPYFQREIYRKHGKWVPRRRIRVSFEREQHATKAQHNVSVNVRSMRYQGKHHRATALPSKVISYGKKKRKSVKRKRA